MSAGYTFDISLSLGKQNTSMWIVRFLRDSEKLQTAFALFKQLDNLALTLLNGHFLVTIQRYLFVSP